MAKIFHSLLFNNSLTQTVRNQTFNRLFHLTAANMIQVGEEVPSADIYEGTPTNSVNFKEFCKDKKVVVFGVPGAFTPGCSKTHLPGYLDRCAELKKRGVDEIICLSVNDAFVMDAWGRDNGAIGKIRMFADPNASLTTLLGLTVDIPKLGGIRSKRYSMIVEKGIVTFLKVEPDGTGLSCSLASQLPV